MYNWFSAMNVQWMECFIQICYFIVFTDKGDPGEIVICIEILSSYLKTNKL